MGLKNSFCETRGVDPAKPRHLRAVARPALLSGAVLGCWWLFWGSRTRPLALDNREFGVSGLCGVTIFLLSLGENFCTS